MRQEHTYTQTPPCTPYRRVTCRRYDLQWSFDQAAVDYGQKSDGMYSLLING